MVQIAVERVAQAKGEEGGREGGVGLKLVSKETCRNGGGKWSTAKEMSYYLLSPISRSSLSYLPSFSPLRSPLCAPHTWSIKRSSERKVGERGGDRIHSRAEVASRTQMLEAHQTINVNLLAEVRSVDEVGAGEEKRKGDTFSCWSSGCTKAKRQKRATTVDKQ